MRVVALACLALLPGATAAAAQEAHTVVLVQAVVVPPVQSGISDTVTAGRRGSSAGATSSRQLAVSSGSPVIVSAAIPGGRIAWQPTAAAQGAGGDVGREGAYPLAAIMRKAETVGARVVTISVAVN